jgi:hypothetical protein
MIKPSVNEMFSHLKKVAFMGGVRICLNFQHLSGKIRQQIIQAKNWKSIRSKIWYHDTYIICLNTA